VGKTSRRHGATRGQLRARFRVRRGIPTKPSRHLCGLVLARGGPPPGRGPGGSRRTSAGPHGLRQRVGSASRGRQGSAIGRTVHLQLRSASGLSLPRRHRCGSDRWSPSPFRFRDDWRFRHDRWFRDRFRDRHNTWFRDRWFRDGRGDLRAQALRNRWSRSRYGRRRRGCINVLPHGQSSETTGFFGRWCSIRSR
jgi:hypothetical protein